MTRTALPILALLGLAGCADGPSNDAPAVAVAEVHALAETDPVGTGHADAADDPAIWRMSGNPAASLIVGTDKKAGLYAYGLDGKVRSYLPAGLLNNVDLIAGPDGALAAASDRTDKANSRIALFSLSREGQLAELGTVSSGPGEAYGFCLQRRGATLDRVTAYAALKEGTIREVALSRGPDGQYDGTIGRSWKIETQIEGCVTDPATGDLYVGEEDVGIWRIRTADPAPAPQRFASVGTAQGLVADVEGLAFASNGAGRDMVIASSQGDNSYAVLDARDGSLLGRFRIADGPATDGTSETDGIELALGDLGPGFPQGLFVAQDGSNPGAAQNFKLVSWQAVLQALGLE